MCKKLSLGALGLLLVGGFLFGGNLIPYVSTAVDKARHAAKQQVGIDFQISAAEKQLGEVGPEIKRMVHQIAKEKVEVKRLEAQLVSNRDSLRQSKNQMLTLRQHLESGDEFYTAANLKTYTTARVEEDLNHRLDLYETAQQTIASQEQVLAARQSAVEAALAKLDEAKSLQRELEVKIENLRARNRLNEVAKTASDINMDNSALAQASATIDDISAQIDADTEMLQMVPKYFGQIPVDEDSIVSQRNPLDRMDALFNVDTEVVAK